VIANVGDREGARRLLLAWGSGCKA